jgi:Holliday junction resolvase RusA-like endonuclease
LRRNMIEIMIDGDPVGKGRPRVYKNHGITRAVTPEKTRSYEAKIKAAYIEKYGGVVAYPDQALRARILISMGIPKSTGKKRRKEMLQGMIRPTKKPDIDNATKVILDGLNGLAYGDDKQIVELKALKCYAKEPFVLVQIEETKENEDEREEIIRNVQKLGSSHKEHG